MSSRPLQPELMVVSRTFIRDQHLAYDPDWVDTVMYLQVGEVVLFDPRLASEEDRGWWRCLIVSATRSQCHTGWVHPGTLSCLTNVAIGATGNGRRYAEENYWSTSGSVREYYIHCHSLGEDISRDPDHCDHVGSCLPCLRRMMLSHAHAHVLLDAVRVLGYHDAHSLTCVCTWGKHRSYSMAWLLFQLTRCNCAPGHLRRWCRAQTPCRACTASECADLLIATYADFSPSRS